MLLRGGASYKRKEPNNKGVKNGAVDFILGPKRP